jgi:hypothetical protein
MPNCKGGIYCREAEKGRCRERQRKKGFNAKRQRCKVKGIA